MDEAEGAEQDNNQQKISYADVDEAFSSLAKLYLTHARATGTFPNYLRSFQEIRSTEYVFTYMERFKIKRIFIATGPSNLHLHQTTIKGDEEDDQKASKGALAIISSI
ncbi:hypothetical protein CIHG_04711 [Coccidioides immitis H538.4]|uniref:Uncharacterized protein n=2 Tax=Coccidioides immitis TaxID=5501 RepID=A0A0J8RRP3_COCIT|nr:hypothetical protein CIRG_08131 [Coccidioides immitis RMSCC 2394]KMU87266.1 hypothetical protein CIHG_04711 [Coccidioides immitis H538.4]